MICFACDYAEGAHEAILQRFLETNRESVPGYGEDRFTESAKKIRLACGDLTAEAYPAVPASVRNARL